ncbi:hypothetical protein Tco_0853111 [Tanacetum coccineum]
MSKCTELLNRRIEATEDAMVLHSLKQNPFKVFNVSITFQDCCLGQELLVNNVIPTSMMLSENYRNQTWETSRNLILSVLPSAWSTSCQDQENEEEHLQLWIEAIVVDVYLCWIVPDREHWEMDWKTGRDMIV